MEKQAMNNVFGPLKSAVLLFRFISHRLQGKIEIYFLFFRINNENIEKYVGEISKTNSRSRVWKRAFFCRFRHSNNIFERSDKTPRNNA